MVCWEKLGTETQKVAEKEQSLIDLKRSETETNEAGNADASAESAYWFIPQADVDGFTGYRAKAVAEHLGKKVW